MKLENIKTMDDLKAWLREYDEQKQFMDLLYYRHKSINIDEILNYKRLT